MRDINRRSVATGLSPKRTQQDTALKKKHQAKKSKKLETKMHRLTKMSGKTTRKIQTNLSSPLSNLTTELNGSTVFLGTKMLTLRTRRSSDSASSERTSGR